MKITKETKALILQGVTSFCPWYGEGKDKAYYDLRKVVASEPILLEIDGKVYIAQHVNGEPCYLNVDLLDSLTYINL
jgi:hypothetical protein